MIELVEQQKVLEIRVSLAGAELKSIPGIGMGEMGLTPDHVKASPEYQEAMRRYRMAFQALREFNGKHAKEIRLLTNRQR
jgi:hypothetical protein